MVVSKRTPGSAHSSYQHNNERMRN